MRVLPILPTAGNTGLTLYIHGCIFITLRLSVVTSAQFFPGLTGK
ncbi:hypothetical protein RNAN_2917 [Rheinheimera nanhaiensis E407-8]|uniref:Uncharacterized protein n=1 Tax=Rheinheimera nanhaiensis E407-8 TaxID=562729 RepID=I1E0S6_9GAMM|nr:hypothetical protein RNAN_2917 [Rheinheimera nanhaiensis E407-8]